MAAETEELLIVGTGSQARYAIEVAEREFQVSGLIDLEDKLPVGRTVNGVEVTCRLSDLDGEFDRPKPKVIVCHGNVEVKKEAVAVLARMGFQFAALVARTAYVSPSASVGEGTLVNPNACVLPNARIGGHAVVHSNATIEHDNILEDFCNIAPGVSLGGNVRVGGGSYVYVGATVKPGITIGRNCVVGAGAVVIRDVPDNQVVVGVPARFLKWNRGN